MYQLSGCKYCQQYLNDLGKNHVFGIVHRDGVALALTCKCRQLLQECVTLDLVVVSDLGNDLELLWTWVNRKRCWGTVPSEQLESCRVKIYYHEILLPSSMILQLWVFGPRRGSMAWRHARTWFQCHPCWRSLSHRQEWISCSIYFIQPSQRFFAMLVLYATQALVQANKHIDQRFPFHAPFSLRHHFFIPRALASWLLKIREDEVAELGWFNIHGANKNNYRTHRSEAPLVNFATR